MAYFNNAATTYPKPDCVYDFMDTFYRNTGASVGRGASEISSSFNLVKLLRNNLQRILQCENKDIIFTPTATLALNIILQGLLKKKIQNVYITPFEHNAVTRILHHYEKQGLITVDILPVNGNLTFNQVAIEQQFKEHHPDLVVVSHASNVIGCIAPVREIFTLAKKYSAITVLDMAQTAGLIPFHAGSDLIDFAVFAGHKTLYGPTGISGFVMKRGFDLEPTLFGGTGFDSANQDMPNDIPQKYEMGTMNILGIAGLYASTKWILETGIDKIREKENEHRARLLSVLGKYRNIDLLYAKENVDYVGVVSGIFPSVSSDSLGPVFDRLGIAVRTGLQCAPLAHKFLKTFPAGTVRFSISYFTKEEDFFALEEALDYVESNL